MRGNFVGTDPTGLIRIANSNIGVDVISATNTVVGGAGTARNIISGNGGGMQIRTGATGTLVQNNYIGLNVSGTGRLRTGSASTSTTGEGGNIIGDATAGPRQPHFREHRRRDFGGLDAAPTGTIVGNFIGTGAGGVGQLANSGTAG